MIITKTYKTLKLMKKLLSLLLLALALNATAQNVKTERVRETRSAVIVIGISLNENEISLLLTGKTPEHRIL